MKGVTGSRRIDAEFLALPRRELADAALTAAVQSGASYADLRIHAITTETMQLRDGELETAVVDHEIGVAARVIFDGTWGCASPAALGTGAAADTAPSSASRASSEATAKAIAIR